MAKPRGLKDYNKFESWISRNSRKIDASDCFFNHVLQYYKKQIRSTYFHELTKHMLKHKQKYCCFSGKHSEHYYRMNELTDYFYAPKHWKKLIFFININIALYYLHLTVVLLFLNEASHQYSCYFDSNRDRRLFVRMM